MIKLTLNNLFDICFATLLVFLPFSLAIPNILLVFVFIILILKKQRVQKIKLYWFVLISMVSYQIIKSIYFNNFLENINNHLLFLLLLFITYLFTYVNNKYLIVKAFILGTLISVLFSFFKITKFFIKFHNIPLANNKEVYELLTIDRPYIGFMCLCSIILCDYLNMKSSKKNQNKIYYSIIFILILFLFVIVARLALILAFSYIIIRSLNYFKNNKILVLGLIVLFGLSLTFNKSLIKRFQIKNNFSETIMILKKQEPRYVIWDCVFETDKISFSHFIGYQNYKNVQAQLNECFNSKIENKSKRDYYLKKKFNSHNQFFDFYLAGGLISTFFLLILIIISIFNARNDLKILYLIISLILFMVVENIFARQVGVYLFSFLLFLSNYLTQKNKKVHRISKF